MGKINVIILVILLLVKSVSETTAQVNRYMVFFNDKNGSAYNIDNPQDFLSSKAVERRNRYNIDITLEDIPVVGLYVDLVDLIDSVRVTNQTKWMNGVLVEAEISKISLLEDLAFVKEVRFVAPGSVYAVDASSFLWNSLAQEKASFKKSQLTNELQNNMLAIGEMHTAGYTGAGKLIAVFDAGFVGTNISPHLSRLYDNDLIRGTRDFVKNSKNVYQYDDHGTSVLSTISGYTEDVYVGTAPDAQIILCVTEDIDSEYVIEEYNWIFAAEYADSLGVDIINTSLGYNTFYDPDMDYSFEDMDGNTAIITKATDMAASKGILCVVSVGNEGNNNWRKIVAPADADSVLSVGAVDANMDYVTFSSSGPTADNRIKPEVSAFGDGTSIVGWDGLITSGRGTSYAAPQITGLAAGIWQAYPDLNNIELLELIKKGSSQYSEPDTLKGFGIPNFLAIRSEITSLDEDLNDKGIKIYPNPVENGILFVEMVNPPKTRLLLDVAIHDVRGSIVFDKKIRIRRSRHELDLRHLTAGIYVILLSSGNDYLGQQKILLP